MRRAGPLQRESKDCSLATTGASERRGQTYPYKIHEHPEPRPRDDRDAAKDIARDLSEIASHIGQLKGEASAYLTNPNYERLKLRLEGVPSSLRWKLLLWKAATTESRRSRVRLNQGS
jgi:hypothetical protein